MRSILGISIVLEILCREWIKMWRRRISNAVVVDSSSLQNVYSLKL